MASYFGDGRRGVGLNNRWLGIIVVVLGNWR